MSSETLYKFLEGRNAPYVPGFRYRLRRWQPPVQGKLVACENGYHLLRVEHLSRWIGTDLYVAEMDGDWLEAAGKIVCRRARIVEHLPGWNERTARLAAADFAEAVLPIFEEQCPEDDRPRLAIQAARDYANGLIDDAALYAARYAAEAAARVAAWAAAKAAAKAAARVAAGAAAEAAAWYAVEVTAEPAGKAAEAALRAVQGEIILDYAYGRHRD